MEIISNRLFICTSMQICVLSFTQGIDIFKAKIGLLPGVMNNIFKFFENAAFNFRKCLVLECRHNETKKIWDNQRHSTVSSKALKTGTQVIVLVDCVRLT